MVTVPNNKDGEDAELFRFWAQELCASRKQVSNAIEWCRTTTEVRNTLCALMALKKACPKTDT
jgi:hypothetical protein